MLIQITVLAWLFLGERILGIQIVGLLLAAAGALLVQVRPQMRSSITSPSRNT